MKPCHALIAAIAITLSACSTPSDSAGLAGTYAMLPTWNADTLWLRADKRWVRRFKSSDAPAVTDSGEWFVARNGRSIALKGFPKRWAFVHDLMGDTTQGRVLATPMTLSLTVSRARMGTGRLRLGWYPEWNWYFARVD